jgi:hypothetical protein
MAKDRSKPLSEVTFYCKPCVFSFKAEPGRVEDAPERDYHPWAYFANCPKCGNEREQSSNEQNLLKAWSKSTGPRTPEGKAASAANLEGHPTREEALRTRFNAMKHGMFARTASYFPAKPDGYSFCSNCDVDRIWCGQQPACAKQTEIFLMHHAAFEQRDPKMLTTIHADMQASVFAIIQTIIQTIIADGVKFETVIWDRDENDQVRVAEYVDEHGMRRIIRSDLQAHPLLRQLGELLTRTGLSLTDMGMTMKVIEGEESEFGQLNSNTSSPQDLTEFQQKQIDLLAGLRDKVMRANQQTEKDPILLEYQKDAGG